MTTTWRIALICISVSGALVASSVLDGCSNDVPTPPWLPNYVDSGYGGKGGAGGKGGGSAGSAGSAGSGIAAAAGEAEDSSGGAAGDPP
jgi:hypothetical protein